MFGGMAMHCVPDVQQKKLAPMHTPRCHQNQLKCNTFQYGRCASIRNAYCHIYIYTDSHAQFRVWGMFIVQTQLNPHLLPVGEGHCMGQYIDKDTLICSRASTKL